VTSNDDNVGAQAIV